MTTGKKRLTRSTTEKMVGGVCGGLGQYFDIDPTLIRILFAILILAGFGSPLLLYFLLWIIMPPDTQVAAPADQESTDMTPAAPESPTLVETKLAAEDSDATDGSTPEATATDGEKTQTEEKTQQ